MPSGASASRKVALSAMPVTMPGSASGSTTRRETAPRPKNSNRDTARAASVPSTRAMSVAPTPAFTDVHSASRTPGLCTALSNHSSCRALERPALRAALVERVHDDHQDRHVDEGQDEAGGEAQSELGAAGQVHGRASEVLEGPEAAGDQ